MQKYKYESWQKGGREEEFSKFEEIMTKTGLSNKCCLETRDILGILSSGDISSFSWPGSEVGNRKESNRLIVDGSKNYVDCIRLTITSKFWFYEIFRWYGF